MRARVRSRDAIDGRPRGVLTKFGISRVRFRDMAHRGEILVTTTRRALGFCLARRHIRFQSDCAEGCCTIRIATRNGTMHHGPSDLDGLTFYVDDPGRTRLFIDNAEVPNLLRHPPDSSGRRSVSLPWRRLVFPGL